MNKSNSIDQAVGQLARAIDTASDFRGGNQAVQKILGVSVYTGSGKKWFLNSNKLFTKSCAEVDFLTGKIEKWIEKRGDK